MAKDNRSPYQIIINGAPHVTLLDSADAERYGDAATPVDEPTPADEWPVIPAPRTRRGAADPAK